uniref:G-protein coupled receptors family 1 profile domain-containing protein n=1 Tax=Petromyzon marinus TaxID=7757 RepID=S4REF4_PETMA
CVYNCWFYGHAFCKVHHFLHAFLPTASTMHFCCIGYDRYLAICDPFHYQERFTRRTAVIALAATWREHNATKTVSIILGIFICWAPFFGTIVIDPYLNYTTKPVVWEMLNWIGHVNSAINPFLYGCFNRTFRNAICIIFSRRLLQPGIRSAEL